MFDYAAGFNSSWDNSNDCPMKNLPPRIFPNEHPFYDEAKWLEGYDDGLEASKYYNEGYAVGLVNGPNEKSNPYFSLGWYAGRLIFLKKQIKPILKAAGKLNLMVCETHYPDRDDIEGIEYPGGESYKPLKKSDLLNGCIEILMDSRYGKDRDIPTTMEEIIELFHESNDSEWGCVRVITRAVAKKEQDEKEYKKIERAAQSFAASCGKTLGTKDFICALDKAVNVVRQQKAQWNNPEVRMEEWAAHRFAGSGSESYFDDLNFENGRYEERLARLEDVWSYLERKFPIMMLRYKESKARRKARRKPQ